MKTIIAGSRSITNIKHIEQAVAMFSDAHGPITEVVCGGARGADQLGREWGDSEGIPVKMFPANWDLYGRGAGPIRNKAMGDYADAGIVVWDGTSRGSLHMYNYLKLIKKPCILYLISNK